MDPTQAMDPITQLVTYLLPGVPVGVLLALTWLVTYVFSNFTQSLVSPVEGGSRGYLFFFRLCHRFAGNNGLVRKPPKPYPEVRRLGTEGAMAHLMAANEELRLAEDKPDPERVAREKKPEPWPKELKKS
jgi:hypothetical protein